MVLVKISFLKLFSIFPENGFKITATCEENVVKMSPRLETVTVVVQSWFWKSMRLQPAKHKKINDVDFIEVLLQL